MDGVVEYKIWLGGLNFATTEDDLRQAVSYEMGSRCLITSVKVVYEHDTGRSKGFGFVGCVRSLTARRLAVPRSLFSTPHGLDPYCAMPCCLTGFNLEKMLRERSPR